MSKTTIHSLEVTFTCMAEWTREADGETRACGTQIRSPKNAEGDGDSFTVECERCGTIYDVGAKAGAKKGKRETSGDAPAHDSYGRPVKLDGTPWDGGVYYDERDAGEPAKLNEDEAEGPKVKPATTASSVTSIDGEPHTGKDDNPPEEDEDDEPHADDDEETAAEKRARKARNKKRREAAAVKREEDAAAAGSFPHENADPNA